MTLANKKQDLHAELLDWHQTSLTECGQYCGKAVSHRQAPF